MSKQGTPVSPHKSSPSIKNTLLAKHLSFRAGGDELRRSSRRKASLGYRSDQTKEKIRKDLQKASDICRALMLNLIDVAESLEFESSRDIGDQDELFQTLYKNLKKFFGTDVEEDSDWRSNLWHGSFHPIIAFCSMYKVTAPDWSDPANVEEKTYATLTSYSDNFGVAYILSAVYFAIGEAAQEFLKTVDTEQLLSSSTWDDIKYCRIVAFEHCDNAIGLYNHMTELIKLDRRLRKL